MEHIISQFITFFDKHLNKKQKIIIISSIAILILLITFLILFNVNDKQSDAKYKILFSSLSAKDSVLVIDSLNKNEIPYRITDDKIYVPRDVAYEQRIKLSAQGIPKSSKIGFELFDKDSFGSTDFEQKIKYLRAIEGELSRTIESLKPIKKAIVHVAIPESSVFVSKEVLPSASVAITLDMNMVLSSQQVQGIKNLVASGVPKLTTARIKIVDNLGQPLDSDSKIATIGRLATMQMAYKRKLERDYEEKIIAILAPIVGGEDSLTAKVTIEFDFTQTSSTEENFNPNNIVRSEKLSEEKKDGVKIQDKGGIPGAISNIGPVAGVSDKNKEEYSKTQSTTNYEISKKVSTTEKEFATILRIHSAVIIDGNYKIVDKDGKKSMQYVPRSKDELKQMKELVKRAVSFDEKRKDRLSISNFRFSFPNLKKIKSNLDIIIEMLDNNRDIFKYLIAAFILFIAYKIAIYPFIGKMLDSYSDDLDRKTALVKLSEIEEEENNINKADEMRKRIADQLSVKDADEDQIRYELMNSKIKEYLLNQPEEAGILFSTLVRADKND